MSAPTLISLAMTHGKATSLAALTLLGLVSGPAHSAIVANAVTSTTDHTYDGDILDNDLINGVTPSASSGSVNFDADGIWDGVDYETGGTQNGTSYLINGDVSYTFDLTGSATGYDITSITSIAGWVTNAHNHAAQNYQVEVSLVGSAAYTSLNITGTAASGGNALIDAFANGQGASKITITEDSSGIIASGVDSIRFNFFTGGGLTNSSVFHEVDVVGVATPVPEPSAILLGTFGCILLLRRKR